MVSKGKLQCSSKLLQYALLGVMARQTYNRKADGLSLVSQILLEVVSWRAHQLQKRPALMEQAVGHWCCLNLYRAG